MKKDAFDLGDDKDSRFHDSLEKISQFQNFSIKKVPYAKVTVIKKKEKS